MFLYKDRTRKYDPKAYEKEKHPIHTYALPFLEDYSIQSYTSVTTDNYRVSGALEKLEHERILQDRASDR